MSNMQLDTLRRIVQEINASTSMHESLDIMVNQVAEAMHVDVCSIYLLDERNQRYLLMASKGLNPESVGHVSLHTGEGLVGLVGQREEIVNLDDAPKHERFMYLPETGEAFTLKRWKFEIADMDGRKVDKVLATPVKSALTPVE